MTASKFFMGVGGALLLVIVSLFIYRQVEKQEKIEETYALVKEWLEKLDGQTTDTGVYERWEGEELPAVDNWGKKLRVTYSQGGFMEILAVRSAGPDGQFHTNDDISGERHAQNLKGVGSGVKKNIEETAENAGRGFFRGAAEGLKEGLKKEDKAKE